MITIFTDGSSRGNPGPGGWGTVVVDGDTVTELGGAEANTTNNKMELTAALRGLEATPADAEVRVYTDSKYLIQGITTWIKGWIRNGWKTQTKEDVSNRDLWEELHPLTKTRSITWEYIGGHVGIAGNERCDDIATKFADGEDAELFTGPLGEYSIKNILDVSHDETLAVAKKSSSSRSKAAAYSYVSLVNGKVETHKTWAECENRVKGAKGAKYKKTLNAGDESALIAEYKQATK